MWMQIAILALIFQFLSAAPLIHEVSLNSEPDNEITYGVMYMNCFLMELTTSKNKVKVTSSTLDVKNLKAKQINIHVSIAGNVNYPEYFPQNLGKLVDGIIAFNYKSTPLKYVTRDDFRAMASELFFIDLSDNEIEELPHDIFYDLTELNYFDIRDNKLRTLASNIFGKSPGFQNLVVKSNELTELHPDLFKDCPEFFILNADFNKIEKLHVDLFKNNPNMSVISMGHNKIKNIPIDFNRFLGLRVADFLHNAGTCDTIYFEVKPFVEYYNEEDQKKWIKTIPEFQQKVEEVCRG